MGVDTKGVLSKDIKAVQIYDVITTKFDQDAKFYVTKDEYRDTESGNICFKYKEENRSLFYCITSDRVEDLEYDKIPHVNLIMSYWGSSVEIVTEIIKCFGGYIDENDCDEVDYFYIPKDESFDYGEYVTERNKVISILDADLKSDFKVQIANQIMKHKEEFKKLFM